MAGAINQAPGNCQCGPGGCGESCANVCSGAAYQTPGTVTNSAGSKAIGRTDSLTGFVRARPSSNLYTLGDTYYSFNAGGNCWEPNGPVKYFYAIQCVDGDLWVGLFINAAIVAGPAFDACGGGKVATGQWIQTPVQYANGQYYCASSVILTVDSCSGPIALSFSLPAFAGWATTPTPVPLTGTISLPLSTSADHACCQPCPIPEANLTLTLSTGGPATTLIYDAPSATWSGGSFAHKCLDDLLSLTGGGTWTLDEGATTCNPYHAVFTNGGTTAYIDE